VRIQPPDGDTRDVPMQVTPAARPTAPSSRRSIPDALGPGDLAGGPGQGNVVPAVRSGLGTPGLGVGNREYQALLALQGASIDEYGLPERTRPLSPP